MKRINNKSSVVLERKARLLTFFVILLFTGMLITAVYLYVQYESTQDKLHYLESINTGDELTEQGIKKIIGKLSDNILLPKDVEPTVATIVDVEALKKQNSEFYKNAQNGDRVIIYQSMAILYRDKDDIIINIISPVNTEDTANSNGSNAENQTEQSDELEDSSMVIGIINGTYDSQADEGLQEQLGSAYDNVQVTFIKNASKVYDEKIMYILNVDKIAELTQIANELGYTVSTSECPEEISNFTGDAVILIGQ